MGLTGLTEIVKAAEMAVTVEFAYDFQRCCASLISTKSPPMG